MNIEIRYDTINSDIKTFATIISEITGSEIKDFIEPLEKDTDILFMCSSKVNTKVEEFIDNINVRVKNVVLISTYQIINMPFYLIKNLLEFKGIDINYKFGKPKLFGLLKINEYDYNNLTKYVVEIIKNNMAECL